MRKMPTIEPRCAPPNAAIARRTRTRFASAGGGNGRATRRFATGSVRATARGSAASATSRSTGSRSPTATRCCSGRATPAPSAGDPRRAVRRSLPRLWQGARPLCVKCNSALGFCNDSPALLLAAAAYLRAACEHEGTMPMTAPSTGEACAPPRERAAGNGSFADARHCRCAGKAV